MIKFGVTNEVFTLPLVHAIQQSQNDHPFKIIHQSAEKNSADLLQNNLEIAFITPLDYARNSSELKLIKDFAIYTTGESNYAALVFTENLVDFKKIVYSQKSQYLPLADIILKEFFDVEAEWQHLEESNQKHLAAFPVSLLVGEEAVHHAATAENHIDIVEEWTDKCESAYIHQLLAIRKADSTENYRQPLLLSRELGMRNLMAISKEYAADKPLSWDVYFDLFNKTFQYFPDDSIWNDLQQYFESLYYHRIVDYIPDVHF